MRKEIDMELEPSIVVPSAERRRFLGDSAAAAVLLLAGCATQGERSAEPESEESSGEAEVTPGEDLMQEHGVLERVLLVYGEVIRRVERNETVDPMLVSSAAGIVRRFVEDYHERNEEQFIFPRLRSAKREVQTVETLLLQHQRGRELTDEIMRLTKTGVNDQVAGLLRKFERMYRPHAAREDTVIFPAFRSVVGRNEYAELGERFEDDEHEKLGEHGFENAVAEVARIETALGIFDLAAFTP
jgi:hemerythrin-like domain-containing protein